LAIRVLARRKESAEQSPLKRGERKGKKNPEVSPLRKKRRGKSAASVYA